MTVRQQANDLITYFMNRYKEYHGEKPVVNRNKEQWAFRDLLEDYTLTEIKELIDYHFKIDRPDSSLKAFLGSYDILLVGMRSSIQQRLNTEKLLKQTKERLDIWRSQKKDS